MKVWKALQKYTVTHFHIFSIFLKIIFSQRQPTSQLMLHNLNLLFCNTNFSFVIAPPGTADNLASEVVDYGLSYSCGISTQVYQDNNKSVVPTCWGQHY